MAEDRTLWVGGLSEKVTEELLFELFLQAGPLEKVTIPKDKEGRKKKFAFVEFRHDVSVPYTLQLMEGVQLFGQTLRLQTRSGSSHNTPPQGSPMPYNSPQYGNDQRDLFHPGNNPRFHRSGSGHENMSGQGSPVMYNSPQHHPDYRQAAHPGDGPSRFQRSHTWHGGDRDNRDSDSNRMNSHLSPQHRSYQPNMSPGSGHMNMSPDYPNRSPQYREDQHEHMSTDMRRQRVLNQQNMSLNVHHQHGYGSHGNRMPSRQHSSSRRRY